jgi:hypothetical protein
VQTTGATSVNWFGLLFINNSHVQHGDASDQDLARFTLNWVGGIAHCLKELIGTRKLGLVFRKLTLDDDVRGFEKLLATHCLIRSKPESWEKDVEKIIFDMEKESLYLLEMLKGLIGEFRLEVNTFRNQQQLEALIARVQAKRKFGNIGQKGVKRAVSSLEKKNYFRHLTKKKRDPLDS